MNPEDFIPDYERALASQDWNLVDPLVHDVACVTFSTGSIHKGKPEVKKAFAKNFSLIQNEVYTISNVHWVLKGSETAVYLFDFDWNGYFEGKKVGGSGRGTSVLVRENKKWLLLVEHLSARS